MTLRKVPSVAPQNDGDRGAVIGQLWSHSRRASVPAVNCNAILKTETQNFERLKTPLKRLHSHGVRYSESYNGTLHINTN